MAGRYVLIDKAVFFPEEGILAIGDLHLGYEQMLKDSGVMIPFNQLEQSIKDLKNILNKIKNLKSKKKVKKIVLLGDLKHHFSFKREEKFEIRDFFSALDNLIGMENVIVIRGNHDKIKLNSLNYVDYYIHKDIAFTHGHKLFPEIADKKIKTIVMAHLHTAVFLSDRSRIKREKYKCFLIGKWKGKEVIILPSFFPLIEGSGVNDLNEGFQEKGGFSFIPVRQLRKFSVFIIGDEKIFNFGKLEDLY